MDFKSKPLALIGVFIPWLVVGVAFFFFFSLASLKEQVSEPINYILCFWV